MEDAADRWGLSLLGYHDAGHASVGVTATDSWGRAIFLKAWTDPARYRHEVAALRHWRGDLATKVVEAADDLAVAALEMVGGRPGGADRPAVEQALVAQALDDLHAIDACNPPVGIPRLSDYIRHELTPRIRRRLHTVQLAQWMPVAHAGLRALDDILRVPGRETVLHGDLYRENVLFADRRSPVFVDPLPMLGPAAFDWAFWVVYYEAGSGIEQRLELAVQVSGLSERDIHRWCSLLFLDGLLYYLEISDPRAVQFGKTAAAFAVRCEANRP
ncbi:aminoglycoside phosphotransferase family protein [Kribbella pittospori]|nr:aminoglycoside phosphotransferase family protein [Kribbella pittospori]